MNLHLPSGLLACLLLSGCTFWKSIQDLSSKDPELPQDPLATSKSLAADGRWGEALTLLDRAIAQGWSSPAYLSAREITLQEKLRLEQELQDRLLIEETKAQQTQFPLLSEMVRLDPANQAAEKSLTAIRQTLQAQRRKLSECGSRQMERHPDLAQTCLELALSLEATQRDRQLLNHLTEKEKQSEQAKAQQQLDMQEQARKDRIEYSLQEAKSLYEKDQFNPARKQLNQVLAEEPTNSEAKKMLSELEKRLQSHLDYLLKKGDKLYQQGEIERAQAIWKAALRLDPENSLAKEKLERASRVLENLENLRRAEQVKKGEKTAP